MIGSAYIHQRKPVDADKKIRIVKGSAYLTYPNQVKVDSAKFNANFNAEEMQAIGQNVSQNLSPSRGRIIKGSTLEEESRDENWASPTEEVIRSILGKTPNINISSISVTCRATLCRATGKADSGLSNRQEQSLREYIIEEKFFNDDVEMNALPLRSEYGNSMEGKVFIIEFSRVKA